MPGKKEKIKKKKTEGKKQAKNKTRKGIVKTVKEKKSRKTRGIRRKHTRNSIDKENTKLVKEEISNSGLKPVEELLEKNSNKDVKELNPKAPESIFEIKSTKDDQELIPEPVKSIFDTKSVKGDQELISKPVEIIFDINSIKDDKELIPKPVDELFEKNTNKDTGGITSKLKEEAVERNVRVELHPKHFIPLSSAMFFMILVLVSLILFLLAGYSYPATEEDIAKNTVFWIINDGKLDRGLFTQFYTSFIFTACVYLLGYYVNSTFVRYGLECWTIFSIGIYMMFLYGLGRIGELTYNHELFGAFKDLILPGALIIIAYASYKISKDLKGEIQHGSQ